MPSLFNPLSLLALRRALARGETTPARIIRESLERISATDPFVHAFVALAPEAGLAAAAEARGPLAGIPLGVKDIYDTADMPTAYGSKLYAGHRPRADATLVAMARAAGAALLGKTETTEFASFVPAPTRNPADLSRTPGGSSSGSAAAVAAGMAAGAFGSQTAGSVIRPAAFCGIAGYKPSFRLLPTVGLKCFAWSLDTAGLFAAGVADVAALAQAITGRDLRVDEPDDPDLSGLTIGLYRSMVDDRLEPAMAAAMETAADRMEAAGARLVEIHEPETLATARTIQPVIQDYEGALALAHERLAGGDAIAPALARQLALGAAIPVEEYDAARGLARRGRKAATALFSQVDALLAPSALGPAPAGLESTGDPVMNRLWTLTGNPCVNVPGLATTDGLPLGLTVIARFGRDKQALALAARLEAILSRS